MIQYVDWPSCRAMDLIYAVTRAFIGLLNGCFKALMGVMAGTSSLSQSNGYGGCAHCELHAPAVAYYRRRHSITL